MPSIRHARSLAGHDVIRSVLERGTGSIHMMGIGGVGMAGLALLLKDKGWRVDGCDASEGPLLSWLRGKDIPASCGHDPAHMDNRPDFIVRSPAVARTNPELVRAQQETIPVIDRGRLLPALLSDHRTIAVSGTHGKTTTASMIAWILKHSGAQTSYCIGGICPSLGAVAHAESGGFMVVEADESDGTLQFYEPEIAVITSMDLDHVDYFADESVLSDVYRTFARSASVVVYPRSDRAAVALLDGVPGAVSTGDGGDVAAEHVELRSEGSRFRVTLKDGESGIISLNVPGRHNIGNALCATAAAVRCGIDLKTIAEALALFRLPQRRFETVAEGQGIVVISDYAHHPVEIAALIKQARLRNPKRLIGVFQPHRFSRTKAFRAEFVDVLSELDHVVLAPVYSASEPFVEGGTTEDLFRAFVARGLTRQSLADSLPEAWQKLQDQMQPDDLVLIIGAGDVDILGKWAKDKLSGKPR